MKLEVIQCEAAVAIGLARTVHGVPGSVKKITFVSRPSNKPNRDGKVVVGAMSVGQPHKEIPVTVALAVPAASKIPGTTTEQCVVRDRTSDHSGIDISHTNSKLNIDTVYDENENLKAASLWRFLERQED